MNKWEANRLDKMDLKSLAEDQQQPFSETGGSATVGVIYMEHTGLLERPNNIAHEVPYILILGF